MKIIFNASPAVRPVTGIGTYTKELITHLLQIDKNNHYLLFSIQSPMAHRRLFFSYPKASNISHRSFVFPYRYLNILWNNFRLLPIENFLGEADIIHSLDKTAPFAKKAKTIITMHDMGWYSFGSNSERRGLIYRQIIETLKRASAIITVSEFSKNEIVKYLPFAEEKIYVIGEGVSNRFYPIERERMPIDIHKKYPWDNYILYLGMLNEPRKNLESIVMSYAALKKNKKIKEKLLLCGRIAPGSRNLLRLLKKVNLPNDITVYPRWISDSDIPYIYNKSRLVLLPSLYEGFGLPILESMACGKPIITSDIPPMNEVASDAAILINPKDEVALSNAIAMLLSDKRLYDSMVEKGFKRCKEFNWVKVAEEVLRVYENCAAA